MGGGEAGIRRLRTVVVPHGVARIGELLLAPAMVLVVSGSRDDDIITFWYT